MTADIENMKRKDGESEKPENSATSNGEKSLVVESQDQSQDPRPKAEKIPKLEAAQQEAKAELDLNSPPTGDTPTPSSEDLGDKPVKETQKELPKNSTSSDALGAALTTSREPEKPRDEKTVSTPEKIVDPSSPTLSSKPDPDPADKDTTASTPEKKIDGSSSTKPETKVEETNEYPSESASSESATPDSSPAKAIPGTPSKSNDSATLGSTKLAKPAEEEMKLSILGCYRASLVKLCVLRGSVVDFGADSFIKDKKSAAIVNAANEGMLGGGGVDGAISAAGGMSLRRDRLAFPVLGRNWGGAVRCRTGDAKITGPGDYGDLHVPYVIHSVGPNYHEFREDEIPEGNKLLQSAYSTSLDLAYKHNISSVGFSLLSSGIFRGPSLTISQVLEEGLIGIDSWKPPTNESTDGSLLPDVYLCGFTPKECATLVSLCDEKFEKIEDSGEEDDQPSGESNNVKESNDDSKMQESPEKQPPQKDAIAESITPGDGKDEATEKMEVNEPAEQKKEL